MLPKTKPRLLDLFCGAEIIGIWKNKPLSAADYAALQAMAGK